tara:strand:+ start:274 stop:939 length:666 start_codon:yes stop_codon:yes gene_type:complete
MIGSKLTKKKKIYQTFYNRILEKIPKNLKFEDLDSYFPNIKRGRVIKVYDGDSITVASTLPKSKDRCIYKFNIRLNRIDTPEIRTKNEIEKNFGIKIRDILDKKLINKMVSLKIINTDKYGRLLAEVNYKKENINDWLLDNKYAVKYDGGKKEDFDKELFNINLHTDLDNLSSNSQTNISKFVKNKKQSNIETKLLKDNEIQSINDTNNLKIKDEDYYMVQ